MHETELFASLNRNKDHLDDFIVHVDDWGGSSSSTRKLRHFASAWARSRNWAFSPQVRTVMTLRRSFLVRISEVFSLFSAHPHYPNWSFQNRNGSFSKNSFSKALSEHRFPYEGTLFLPQDQFFFLCQSRGDKFRLWRKVRSKTVLCLCRVPTMQIKKGWIVRWTIGWFLHKSSIHPPPQLRGSFASENIPFPFNLNRTRSQWTAAAGITVISATVMPGGCAKVAPLISVSASCFVRKTETMKEKKKQWINTKTPDKKG